MTEFIETGLIDYRRCWALQKQIREEVRVGGREKVLFVEHPAVYTLGVHGKSENLIRLPEGTECIRIERGGDITFHGPGQLVVYSILDLRKRHLGVKQYVHLLEQWVLAIIKHYGIEGASTDDAPGVWIGLGSPDERKICALGVKISHGLTLHGFALNVTTDLSAFSAINPCGFIDKGVTSILRETGKEIAIKDVIAVAKRTIPQELS